jgi:hypothetical protein
MLSGTCCGGCSHGSFAKLQPTKRVNKTPTFAILFGLLAIVPVAFAARIWDVPIAVGLIAVIYFVAGGLFGWIRQPANSFWGFLIAAPIVAVLLFSVAFTGVFTRFWDTDVPFVVTAIITAYLGVIVGRKLAPVGSRVLR